MKYIVVTSSDLSKFVEEVNQKMKEGYLPQGGISSIQKGLTLYMQALIKI